MTENAWKTVFIVAAAVCSFLLIQPQLAEYPWVLLILGAVNVALAAANPVKRATE